MKTPSHAKEKSQGQASGHTAGGPAMSRATRPLLTPAQVARRLGVSVQSLANRRCRGIGPPFIQIGAKQARYDEDLLEEWLKARTFTETRPHRMDGGAEKQTANKKALTRTGRQGLESVLPEVILTPSAGAIATPPR